MLEPDLRATIADLPKIELHRHLEGSLRLDTLVDIAREHGIEMPDYDIETLRPFVQMMPNEPRTAKHFLSKFTMLRQFYRTIEIVQRITREIVEDAAKDNVRYMELRFTPKALCNISDCTLEEIVPLVCDAGNETAEEHGIIVRYIVSMNRHEPVSLGESVLRAAINNQHKGVVGLDLAGNEADFSCIPFRSLFHRAKAAGLGITIHAGEWAGAASVWDAIGNLGASRVGHGISVLEDPALVQVLVDREITLEVCPSSNYLSGIVDSLEDHPLQALTRRHVLTTLNTDDPLLCNITLSDEIALVMAHMDITLDDIKQYMLRAARAAFLPPSEREDLIRQFQGFMAAI
ncbi:MAG: adenosine deaminase [Anaerolineae bacterium]|nr:adenosine deaminase [Anaerolineae bacterium]MDQ7034969.1 adenosine deaminase [Anaerolineae bacterium]